MQTVKQLIENLSMVDGFDQQSATPLFEVALNLGFHQLNDAHRHMILRFPTSANNPT